MDLSGVIFVALAVAWAGYLIPKAVSRHEEDADHRPITDFSDGVRVLSRRGPSNAVAADEPSAPAASLALAYPPTQAERLAMRMAARRRRRILLALLLATAVVGALAIAGVLVPWAPAVPGGLVVAWLVVCRLQVRRLDRARAARRTTGDGAFADPAPVVEDAPLVIEPDEDTVTLDAAALAAASAPEMPSSSLWDPLPVTLPTYVTKARARRTVRTIDLNAPDVVSSGRSEADSQLVADDAAARAADAAEEALPQQAVGS